MKIGSISDHALLRWMERRHGIDVETWRRLMLDEVNASIAQYDGEKPRLGPAFVVADDGTQVITYFSAGWAINRSGKNGVVIREVGGLAENSPERAAG